MDIINDYGLGEMGRPKLFGKGVKIMKTMIYLEEEAHLRLKHLAVDERISMAEVIRRALDEYLSKHPKKGARSYERTRKNLQAGFCLLDWLLSQRKRIS